MPSSSALIVRVQTGYLVGHVAMRFLVWWALGTLCLRVEVFGVELHPAGAWGLAAALVATLVHYARDWRLRPTRMVVDDAGIRVREQFGFPTVPWDLIDRVTLCKQRRTPQREHLVLTGLGLHRTAYLSGAIPSPDSVVAEIRRRQPRIEIVEEWV